MTVTTTILITMKTIITSIESNVQKKEASIIGCIYTFINSPITHTKVNDLSLFMSRCHHHHHISTYIDYDQSSLRTYFSRPYTYLTNTSIHRSLMCFAWAVSSLFYILVVISLRISFKCNRSRFNLINW